MTEYQDRKNNTYKLIQTVLGEGEKCVCTKVEMIEALYRIFAEKRYRDTAGR